MYVISTTFVLILCIVGAETFFICNILVVNLLGGNLKSPTWGAADILKFWVQLWRGMDSEANVQLIIFRMICDKQFINSLSN